MSSSGFFNKKARRPGRFFNMVECALALAVVAIGVVSIVALFPVGLEATRDAIADNYAANSADDFLHFFKGQMQTTSTGWSYYSSPTVLPGTKPGSSEPTSWNTLSETPLVENDSGTPGVFRGQIKNGATIDFSGIFRVWRSTTKYSYYSGSWQTADLDPSKAISLNVEVSWPSQAPYDKRRRALYYLEVFNPN